MSDYDLARLGADAKHKIFVDTRGIEPAIVYCPEKKGFTYAEEMKSTQGIYEVCGHCCEIVEI